MINCQGVEHWPALTAAPQAVKALRQNLRLPAGAQDIYLAYSGGNGSRCAGYLVSRKDDINRVVAYCPIPGDLEIASSMWFREVSRQLQTAIQIASSPKMSQRSADAIWLKSLLSGEKEIPMWVYCMACVPITYDWDGVYRYPRPFCPRLFEALATHPDAAPWLLRQYRAQPEVLQNHVSGN